MSAIEAPNNVNAALTTPYPEFSDFPYGLPRPLTPDDHRCRHWLEKIFQEDLKVFEQELLASSRLWKRVCKEARRSGRGASAWERLIALLEAPLNRAHVSGYQTTRGKHGLESGILRMYCQGKSAVQTTLADIDTRLPWWPAIKDRASRLIGPKRELLALLPTVYADLAQWNERDENGRIVLALAIFAIGSAMDEVFVIDQAVKTQPELSEWFAPLYRLHPADGSVMPYLSASDTSMADASSGAERATDWLVKEIGRLYRLVSHEKKATPGALVSRLHDIHHVIGKEEANLRAASDEDIKNRLEDLKKLLEEMQRAWRDIGMTLPESVVEFARQAEHRVLPFASFAHADQCTTALGVIILRITGFLKAHNARFADLARKHAEVKTLAQTPSANIARIAALSGEILALQKELAADFDEHCRRLTLPPARPEAAPAPSGPPNPPMLAEPSKRDDVDEEKLALLADIEQLQQQLSERNAEIFRLKNRPAPGAVAAPPSGPGAAEIADLLVRAVRVPPVTLLKLLQALYGTDRLLILDSAFESAKRSETFRQTDRLYELLTCLVGDYADALRRGEPDAKARQVLGNAYRAQESEPVQTNRKLAKHRTFRYAGRDVLMLQHVGIGATTDSQTTIRVYFLWEATPGRIIIGYVGPHLPTHER